MRFLLCRLPSLLCAAAAALCTPLPSAAAPNSSASPSVSALEALPPTLQAALTQAQIPADAVALLVTDAEAGAANSSALTPKLAHRIHAPMNPASVMKLTTTFAALDLLGPAFTWSTPVYVEGTPRDGTLDGNVYLRGTGDPKLVLERLWLLLRRLQGLGIRHIHGDIVLDHSAFNLAQSDAAQFDGEPLKPYNASPDALLINYKSVLLTIRPDSGTQQAVIQSEPPLAGVEVSRSVPLVSGECGDYRGRLKADFSRANHIRFSGAYPVSCGEKVWPVAYVDPNTYALRAVQGLWQELGGGLSGTVRWGQVPAALLQRGPSLENLSPPLADVIRDINKFSNNVMAQQLFLTLGTIADGTPASFASASNRISAWWQKRWGDSDLPVWENGSGLSRQERISAYALGALLQSAYRSPWMPELMSSLPVSGVDGTLRRSRAGAIAHLKTGTLDSVIARAGYVETASGQRLVLVAIINHANANSEAARQFMDTLIDWAAQQR